MFNFLVAVHFITFFALAEMLNVATGAISVLHFIVVVQFPALVTFAVPIFRTTGANPKFATVTVRLHHVVVVNTAVTIITDIVVALGTVVANPHLITVAVYCDAGIIIVIPFIATGALRIIVVPTTFTYITVPNSGHIVAVKILTAPLALAVILIAARFAHANFFAIACVNVEQILFVEMFFTFRAVFTLIVTWGI